MIAVVKSMPWKINKSSNVIPQPVPNIAKSIQVKKPRISFDFFVLAGIKY